MKPKIDGVCFLIAILLGVFAVTPIDMKLPFPQFVPVDAQPQVTWKTFTDRNGLFTLQYPSNWSPTPVAEPLGSIDIDFWYYGQGITFAYTNIVVTNGSLFSTSEDAMDSFMVSSASSSENYELERAKECTRYTINGEPACSVIESFTVPEEGYRAALTVIAVDNRGIEYSFTFAASLDVFKHFLPVAERMLESFKVTGDIAPSSSGAPGSSPTIPSSELTGSDFSLDDNITTSTNTTNTTQLVPGSEGTNDTGIGNNLTGADFSIE